jgi:hypothetical protein
LTWRRLLDYRCNCLLALLTLSNLPKGVKEQRTGFKAVHNTSKSPFCITWRLAFIAALAAWREFLNWSLAHYRHGPRREEKEKASLYQNLPNSCKICLGT